MEKIVARKTDEHLECENILPNTLGNYRPAKMTWGNIGTFAYVYERFQNKMETLAVVLDIEDVYNSVDYAIFISYLGKCRIN